MLFPAYINAENIKCKHGVGGSNGNHDVNANVEPPYTKDCDEGITQCMKTGIQLGGEFILINQCLSLKIKIEFGNLYFRSRCLHIWVQWFKGSQDKWRMYN